jgi:hypothetical protein
MFKSVLLWHALGPALALLFAAGLLSTTGHSAMAACEGNRPQDFLKCLQSAYASLDSLSFSRLLADDYRFHAVGPDSTSWDKVAECQSTAAFFRRAHSMRMTVSDGWKIHPGTAKDTWLIDGLTVTLRFRADVSGKQQDQELVFKGNRLLIRRIGQGQFVLAAWWRAV